MIIERTEVTPEWLDNIYNYIFEKPYRYKDLIEGCMGFIFTTEDTNETIEGVCFNLGFLFLSDATYHEEIKKNANKYQVVKNISESTSLDLIGMKRVQGDKYFDVTRYQEGFPLKSLAIGYFGRRPTVEEIDRVFSAYDQIETRLDELE